jgi:hypothetical protein
LNNGPEGGNFLKGEEKEILRFLSNLMSSFFNENRYRLNEKNPGPSVASRRRNSVGF